MVVLGYLPTLKRDLGLPFGAYFQHDFSIKMSVFPSQDIKQNVSLSS